MRHAWNAFQLGALRYRVLRGKAATSPVGIVSRISFGFDELLRVEYHLSNLFLSGFQLVFIWVGSIVLLSFDHCM